MKSRISCTVVASFLLIAATLWAEDRPTQVLARGVVVDPDGKPVANAIIGASLGQAQSCDTYSTNADAAGAFEIVVHNDRKYIALMVSAWTQGYSSTIYKRVPSMGNPGYEDLKLVLRPAVDFKVIVHDDAGKPIAGAKVAMGYISPKPETDKSQESNADGVATFAGMDDQGHRDFWITAADYLPAHCWADDLTKLTIPVVLHKGGTFDCQVVDSDTGKPLANINVDLPYLDQTKYKTDGDGIFHAADVPFGKVGIAFPSSGYTRDWDHALLGFQAEFPPGSLGQMHKLSVRHDFVIEGNVMDAAGKPIAGAVVNLMPLDIRPLRMPLASPWTTTDAAGHFKFDSFSVDHFQVALYGKYKSPAVEARYKDLKGPITLTAAPAEPADTK